MGPLEFHDAMKNAINQYGLRLARSVWGGDNIDGYIWDYAIRSVTNKMLLTIHVVQRQYGIETSVIGYNGMIGHKALKNWALVNQVECTNPQDRMLHERLDSTLDVLALVIRSASEL